MDDSNEITVRTYLPYKGIYYDVGTRLRFKARANGFYVGVREGVIEKFINTTMFIKADDGIIYEFCTTRNLVNFDKEILEIIEPVYWAPPEETLTQHNNQNRPAPWDIEIGWIWYIVIMIVGSIFKERFMVWVMATAIFFLWKSGKFSKKK